MCGRYNLITDGDALMDFFDLVNRLAWRPRYNVAPSQPVPVIRPGLEGRETILARWGLIPHWARDEKFAYRTINARAKTVAEKPVFRSAFRNRRCLIPATGFYEWQAMNGHKQPYNIHLKNQALFAFAGLWERWLNPKGERIDSCTIIVTEANDALHPIHDRMPVILEPKDYATWLDPKLKDTRTLERLLQSYPSDLMNFYPVSRRVGNPANDDPSLLEPLPETE